LFTSPFCTQAMLRPSDLTTAGISFSGYTTHEVGLI
jgi:hypothetical protein